MSLIKAGMCSLKNEVNIQIVNVVSVSVVGILYWCFGHGLIHVSE